MGVLRKKIGLVGFVTLSNPPVNAIGQSIRQGLLDAVGWAEEEALDRIIVTGEGRAFAAGADAREFDGPALEPHLPDVVNAIEMSGVPWIAAINGFALGGGAEIALACRMRIMSPKAQIGFPEVTFGLIPGAGGTCRLPKLVDLPFALEMLSLGKSVNAETALDYGLVDLVEDDPLKAAMAIEIEKLLSLKPVSGLPSPELDETLFDAARETAAKKMRAQIAPQRAIHVVEQGASIPFEDALRLERKTFLELRASEQSKALRHIFFAERRAKAPSWLDAEPMELKHVAVVGGGTMGSGIAYALLNSGISVTIIETDESATHRAQQNVERIITSSLKRGFISKAGADERRDRFSVTTDYGEAGGVSLALEAAFESMDIKRDIFAKLEAAMPEDAVLATNTSYLDVNEIANSLKQPERAVGLHFFAPAHIMKLLEIVRADETGDAALVTGYALAKRLRKIPVLAGVCDGFIGNRILARYREAADMLLMEGCTPYEIDRAMVAFGYAMGPYETQDLSGLEIGYANRRRQDSTRDPKRQYVAIGDRMVEADRLGKKNGKGWYAYSPDSERLEDHDVLNLIREEARKMGIQSRGFPTSEIQHTLLLAMINEAADIILEGIAQKSEDIDLITVFGYGFPRWRGGIMHYADGLGARTIIEGLMELEKADPVAWKISPLLVECASKHVSISDWKRA